VAGQGGVSHGIENTSMIIMHKQKPPPDIPIPITRGIIHIPIETAGIRAIIPIPA